jgi:peptidoglycan/xylan/chitin deacetylase (PgdA/CDA1 family)
MDTILSAIISAVLLLILFQVFSYKRGLRVLMYHKISIDENNNLNVSKDNLIRQFEYFQKKKYTIITFQDFYNKKIPKKPIILTFDDGFLNNKELLLPILKQFKYKATFFIPTNYVGKIGSWYKNDERVLTVEELREITNTGLVDLALHGHEHQSMKKLTIEEIDQEIKQSINFFEENKLPFLRILAYPFGSYPKRDPEKFDKMVAVFQKYNLLYALRIGNKVNSLPIKNPFEIKRIDIRGGDSWTTFRIKILKGRAKLF